MGCVKSKSKPPESSIKADSGANSLPSRKTSTSSYGKCKSFRADCGGNCCTIRQKYKILELIGHGKFGIAYKAERRDAPGELVAIKVMKKNSYLDKEAIREEIKLLEGLTHPNIVNYCEEIEDGPYMFIITEYCSGGELIDYITSKPTFNESDVADIINKLLCALDYCHSKNIAHRDVKPENIMYSSNDDQAELKLIDFGLAKRSTDSLGYQTIVGAPYYVAPEVIEGEYTKACDIWSTGVLLHLLLSGSVAFAGKSTVDVFRSITKGHVNLETSAWDKVSPPAKNLLLKLLDTDEAKRLTAAEALQHRWFKEVKTFTPELNLLDNSVITLLKQYQGIVKFQRTCLYTIVSNLEEEEITKLATTFHKADKESTGYITIKNLVKAFHNSHPNINITNLIPLVEVQRQINYGELVALALNVKQFLVQEQLWELFQCFNAGNGYLSVESMKKLLYKSGHSTEDIKVILKKDILKCKRICFNQFVSILSDIHFKFDEDLLKK